MRKRKKGVKLGRGQKSRKALVRSLIRALVEHGSIETTYAKAKFLDGKVVKLVNLAKVDSVQSKRKVYSFLGNDRQTSEHVFELTKKHFMDKSGGFTRIVKLPSRKGDNARLVRLEWVKRPQAGVKKTKTAKVTKENKKGKRK